MGHLLNTHTQKLGIKLCSGFCLYIYDRITLNKLIDFYMHESDACSVRWHHIEHLYNKSEWGVLMLLYAVKNRDGNSECYKNAAIRSSKSMNKYFAMTGQ